MASDALPWLKFYPRETLADGHFSGWSLEERGAWLTLILHNWIEGSLPSDQQSLARLLHVDHGTMRGLWSAVGDRFIPHPDQPGRLTSPRLEKEREAAQKLIAQRGEAGRKGANSRWDKEKKRHGKRMAEPYRTHTDANATAMAKHSDPDPDPAYQIQIQTQGQSQPAMGGLAGESLPLRSLREALTRELGLPSLISVAGPADAPGVIAFFEAQLQAVGPEVLLLDCLAVAKKSTTGVPSSLKWFRNWLARLPTPKVQP